MTKILAMCGSKQSGKTSAANFLTAYVTSQLARLNPELPLSKAFDQDDSGNIIVETVTFDNNGNKVYSSGIIDYQRQDEDFLLYAQEYIWPYIKSYAFADPLKHIAMGVFGLTYNQCFGSNEDKNSPTDIKWSDMFNLMHVATQNKLKRDGLATKKMTAREFLQYFGTDVCRKIKDECWIDCCINRINEENPEIAVITDCRFANEFKALKKIGAKLVRLKKRVDEKDQHISELDIDSIPDIEFDLVIDNQDMTIMEKNQELLDELYRWEWFKGHIEL